MVWEGFQFSFVQILNGSAELLPPHSGSESNCTNTFHVCWCLSTPSVVFCLKVPFWQLSTPLKTHLYHGAIWIYQHCCRHGACCPLFPVLLTPSGSRQMAALPGSGSAKCVFQLKGTFFLSTVASCTLRMGDWIKEKFWCYLLDSLAQQLLY